MASYKNGKIGKSSSVEVEEEILKNTTVYKTTYKFEEPLTIPDNLFGIFYNVLSCTVMDNTNEVRYISVPSLLDANGQQIEVLYSTSDAIPSKEPLLTGKIGHYSSISFIGTVKKLIENNFELLNRNKTRIISLEKFVKGTLYEKPYFYNKASSTNFENSDGIGDSSGFYVKLGLQGSSIEIIEGSVIVNCDVEEVKNAVTTTIDNSFDSPNLTVNVASFTPPTTGAETYINICAMVKIDRVYESPIDGYRISNENSYPFDYVYYRIKVAY